MADAPAATEVLAAGAVLWRPSGQGIQVALVHRPRYDDWSFPKGQLGGSEHVLLAAVREVAEETGVRVILGRPLSTSFYQRSGRSKRVDYWAGYPAPDGHRRFRPGPEVDDLQWLPVPVARERLSYPRDAELLSEFAAGPTDTVPLILLRHATAGRRGDYPGNDLDRPLDARGIADAELLAGLLACFGRCRVISSAAERCQATVRPYARLTGADLEVEEAFTVVHGADPAWRAGGADPADAERRIAELAGQGRPLIVCAHRENLPLLLSAACTSLGAGKPAGPPLPKGGFWVLHAAGGALAAAERHDPAGTLAGRYRAALRTGSQSSVGGSAPSKVSSQRLTSGPVPPL